MPGLTDAKDQALRDLELSKDEGLKLQRDLRQSKLLLQSIEDNLNKLNRGTAVVEDNMEQIEDALDSWLGKIEKLDKFVNNNPRYAISEFKYLTDKEWLYATAGPMETEADYRQAMAWLRWFAKGLASKALCQAVSDFSREHNGNAPRNYEDIKQYLPSDFNFTGYADMPPEATASDSKYRWIIKDIQPADPIWDTELWVSDKGAMTTSPINFVAGTAVSDAIKNYKAENGGNAPTSSSQIKEYIKYNDNGKELNETDVDEIYKSIMTPIR